MHHSRYHLENKETESNKLGAERAARQVLSPLPEHQKTNQAIALMRKKEEKPATSKKLQSFVIHKPRLTLLKQRKWNCAALQEMAEKRDCRSPEIVGRSTSRC
jgi:hypothetical protein